MDTPGAVEEALDGESVIADVELGGDDALFVTPTRTLVYRGEGLLSDESVEVYDHDIERFSLSEGRRKATLTLVTPLGDEEAFSIPTRQTDAVVPPVLSGILHARGVLEADESIHQLYRFNELTLVLTPQQLLKHVGSPVWASDYEAYPFADVTGFDVERGDVASQLILEIDGRPQRIKTPQPTAREIEHHLDDLIRAYHDLPEDADLSTALASPDDTDGSGDDSTADRSPMTFDTGVDPLDPQRETTESTENTGSTGQSALTEAGFEPAGASTSSVQQELSALREQIEEQQRLLRQQQETIEQLIEELRRGR